jgi:hypothetical protein
MNSTNIFSRIELLFWNLAILALSKSRTLQEIIRRGFHVIHYSDMASIGVLLGISGVVGLVTGYLFYFVAASIH